MRQVLMCKLIFTYIREIVKHFGSTIYFRSKYMCLVEDRSDIFHGKACDAFVLITILD